jgi:tetratricopeptide (TPR) repeat protein
MNPMDKEQLDKFIEDIHNDIENEEYTRAQNLLDEALENHPDNVRLLLSRAKLFRQLQKFGEAFNDLQAILKLNPDHQEAKKLLDLTRSILQGQQLDIYASTNLNNDPWID